MKIPIGITQSIHRLVKINPDVVFSKGGFVGVPVVIAAAILRIPIVIHESDFSPGLATRLTSRFARKICLSFPTERAGGKIEITGNPIRGDGDAERGRKFLNFGNERPIVLVTGGSSGANFLNNLLKKSFPLLANKVNLVWICGKNKKPNWQLPAINCRVFDFLDAEYLDVLAAADLVISRAGANAIFEIAAHEKASVLIPLPKKSSRGDQLENARFFEKNGAAMVLPQSHANPHDFVKLISWLTTDESRRQQIGTAAKKIAPENAAEKIARIILNIAQN